MLLPSAEQQPNQQRQELQQPQQRPQQQPQEQQGRGVAVPVLAQAADDAQWTELTEAPLPLRVEDEVAQVLPSDMSSPDIQRLLDRQWCSLAGAGKDAADVQESCDADLVVGCSFGRGMPVKCRRKLKLMVPALLSTGS